MKSDLKHIKPECHLAGTQIFVWKMVPFTESKFFKACLFFDRKLRNLPMFLVLGFSIGFLLCIGITLGTGHSSPGFL